MSRLIEEQPELELVAQCSTASEGLKALASGVDLILLDYDLGEQTGFTLLTAARQQGYAGRVLMLTAGMRATQVSRALELGASGVFLKHSPPSALLSSVERVMRGEVWLDQALPEVRATATASPLRLTAREKAVLGGVFQGRASKEIASELGVSEGSVKAVLQQLFAKAGVRTRAQLVRIALENPED
jgi:DNA-binding NarL/FixJ family response regulator